MADPIEPQTAQIVTDAERKARAKVMLAAWRLKNKAKIAEQDKRWRASNPEAVKAIGARNRAKAKKNAVVKVVVTKPKKTKEELSCASRERTRRWKERNPGHDKIYYQKAKESIAVAGKRWRDANKDKTAAAAKARAARGKAERHAKAAAERDELSLHLGRRVNTRVEAKAAKAVRYFTGTACAKGHVDERYTSTTACVVCARMATRAWMDANPEKVKASSEAWLATNGDKEKARRAAYQKTPARRQHARDYYESNKEARAVTIKAWQAKNPDTLRATKHNYRAKLTLGGKHTKDDIAFLMKTQGGKCANAWCRVSVKRGYHLDHIMPISKGGSNTKQNLQILCKTCNLRKSSKHPIDFARQNGLLL